MAREPVKPHLCMRYGYWTAHYVDRHGVPMFVICETLQDLSEAVTDPRFATARWIAPRPTLVVAQAGLPHVDIISCPTVEEGRALVNLVMTESAPGMH